MGVKDERYFYNSAWQLVQVDYDDSGWAVAEQYVWDLRYIDAPIYRDERKAFDTNTFDEKLYYTTDANMNVTALVDATTGDR